MFLLCKNSNTWHSVEQLGSAEQQKHYFQLWWGSMCDQGQKDLQQNNAALYFACSNKYS